jgi:hypothetical protein
MLGCTTAAASAHFEDSRPATHFMHISLHFMHISLHFIHISLIGRTIAVPGCEFYERDETTFMPATYIQTRSMDAALTN